MLRADAHLHLFRNGFAGVLGVSPTCGDELLVYERLRSHHGIERALVIGYEGEPRYAGNNDYVVSLAETRHWIAPLVYLSVHSPPPVQQLARWRERGAAGFAVYLLDATDARALCTWPPATLAALGRRQPIISVNAQPAALAVFKDTADSLGGCRILVSHLGLPGRYARPPSLPDARTRLAALLALAPMPHVAVKLSGLYAISDPPHDFPHTAAQPFVDLVLEAFGPSRLLWGSDFSPALDFVSFSQVADVRVLGSCSAGEVEEIMGANLMRLLHDWRRE